MARLEVDADKDRLSDVMGLVTDVLDGLDVNPASLMKLELAVEEIFVNIANYAYSPGTGKVAVDCDVEDGTVTVTFTDRGTEFDPLQLDEPDTGKPIGEREVGGLGIFLAKKSVDGIDYRRADGCNILTMRKFML